MCNWKKWILPGILATLLLTAAAMFLRSAAIEQDLTAKAGGALSAQHGWASVELDGRDALLKGMAPSEAAQAEAMGIAKNAYDVRVVADASELIPLADPFKVSANKADGKIVLDGVVPSDADRASIVEMAQKAAPGAEVVDNMTLARGAPAGFAALAGYGISQLTGLSSGSASLSDLALSVKGVAPTSDVYNSVTGSLAGALPAGGSLVMADVTPPTANPYTFEAIKGSESITLNGFVPSNSTRTALVSAASEAFPGKTVVDNMKLAIGAPNGFEALSTFGVSQLTTLESGRASTNNSDLTVKGIASSSKVYENVTGALKGNLPGNGKLAMADITTPTASPYTFAAVKSANSVVLNGYYPSSAARAAIVAAVKKANPGVAVKDNLKFALGAPAGFQQLAAFGGGQLGQFKTGSASINNSDLTVKGLASTISSYNGAKTALAGNLPGGGKLAMADITPPSANPYVLNAKEDAKGVLLQGYIPNEATRARLVNAAKATTPTKKVTDQLVIASGAPEGFGNIANFGISQLGDLVSGEVSLTNTELSVRGVSPSAAAYDKVTGSLAGTVPSNGRVVLADIKRHSVSPYTFTATKTGSRIDLTGFVETSHQRNAVIASAKRQNPGAEVTDSLQIASGAPNGVNWPMAAVLAIRQTSKLRDGRANVIDNKYSVEGLALTKDIYDDVVGEAHGKLPAGLKLAKEAVRRPDIKPYIWSFTNMENAAPTLSGYVPNDGVNNANQQQIKVDVSSSTALSNSLQIGPGAPKGFAQATALGIEAVGDLKNGKASIVDSVLMVSGEAANGKEANRLRTRVAKGVPAGFVGKHDITFTVPAKPLPVLPKPKPVDLCKSALTEEMRSNKINFETDRAVIASSSHELLNRLVSVLSFCPNASVEIGGHTDSRGPAAYNQRLSEARANAVLEYLSAAGVSSSRLTAVGYGEDQPIADNVTEEGLAANRRIEFIVNR